MIIAWLESLPTVAAGIVVIGGVVALALAGGYLVSRFTSSQVRTAHNDLTGFIVAVIGVIYAVLLAFVAIGVWERFQQAEARSYDEAAAIATVYRDAESFKHSTQLRTLLRAYVRSVIAVEWPQMRRGERSYVASVLLDAAERDVRNLPVTSPGLSNIQAQMLDAIDTAINDREARLTIDTRGINGLMWMVLLVGAAVTVAFTFLFGFDQTLMRQLMIGGLSLLIGLVLFLTIALDYPFRGSIAVSPDAFRYLLANLTGS